MKENKFNFKKKFKNKKVLVTGHTGFKGSWLTYWLVSLGAKVGSTISKNTNYLICGNNPGSKYEKAIQLNIKILDETSFLKILKKEGVTL